MEKQDAHSPAEGEPRGGPRSALPVRWPAWNGVARMTPPPFGPPPAQPSHTTRQDTNTLTRASASMRTQTRHEESTAAARPATSPSPLPPHRPPSSPDVRTAYTPPPVRDLTQDPYFPRPQATHTQEPLTRNSRLTILLALAAALVFVAVSTLRNQSHTPTRPVAAGPSTTVTNSNSNSNTLASAYNRAVTDLAAQPIVRYQGQSPDGSGSWDISVTADGDEIGAETIAGQQVGVLVVGGNTYFRAPASLLPNLPAGISDAQARTTWMTGEPALADSLPAVLARPSTLAARLAGATTGGTGAAGAPYGGPATVDGVPAQTVPLPDGTAYVSGTAPYRILGFDTAGSSGTTVHTDLPPMSAATDQQIRDSLIAATRGLSTALNLGVQFDFSASAQPDCSDTGSHAGCRAVADVRVQSQATVPSAASETAIVAATMTAGFSEAGRDAGGCSQTSNMPADGSSVVMACTGIAPAADGGQPVTHADSVAITITAPAVTQSVIGQLVAREQSLPVQDRP